MIITVKQIDRDTVTPELITDLLDNQTDAENQEDKLTYRQSGIQIRRQKESQQCRYRHADRHVNC